jgi:hypothetical protein
MRGILALGDFERNNSKKFFRKRLSPYLRTPKSKKGSLAQLVQSIPLQGGRVDSSGMILKILGV